MSRRIRSRSTRSVGPTKGATAPRGRSTSAGIFSLSVAVGSATACASAQPAKVPAQEVEAAPITAAFVPARAPSEKIVLGYFTNWAETRAAPCSFRTADVDARLFTDIDFAFAGVEVRNGNVRVGKASELTTDSRFYVVPTGEHDESRLYGEVMALKKQNPRLRVHLSVGGWAFNDEPTAFVFSALVETPERRGHFIRQSIDYLRRHGFDGIDIDWEFPGVADRGGRAEDGARFLLLLREMRAEMHAEAERSGRPELVLTIATPAGELYRKHQPLGEMQAALDWINVMTYDYHGAWDQATGHNAPIAGGAPDIKTTLAQYQSIGVPANKIVLGFATYARAFGAVDAAAPGTPSTAPGPDGPCGKDSLTAAQAAGWVSSGRFTGYWDDVAQVPYAYSKAERAWVSYDDARSYEKKLELLRREGLAGAMFWAIDLDDVRGGYPLIRQVSEALGVTATPLLGQSVAAQ